MKNLSMSEINEKFVLVLKEDANHYLKVEKYFIENTDEIINNIERTVEDSKKTLLDLIALTEYHLDYNKSYNLCFPYKYDSSFIDRAQCPQKMDHSTYDWKIHLITCSANNILFPSKEKRLSYVKNKIAEFDYNMKKNYSKSVTRYIKCKTLSKAFSEIKNDKSIKIFSSDDIGWTTFEYIITEDIKINIKTNFAYGRSRYFFLSVKYKNMVLIPYSNLVHYYYANMKNLISYTYSYSCRRESWYNALQHVADFVNNANLEPESFIRKYILSEVKKMIDGLRDIICHPEEVLERIKYNQLDYISMKVIRPFIDEDHQIYDMLPKESVSVFKAEKITGALMFIENMGQLQDLCPEILPVRNEISEMNKSIETEIEVVLHSITEDLEPLEKEMDLLLKKHENINKQIDFHHKKIIRLQKKNSSCDNKTIAEKYKQENPIFCELLKKSETLRVELKALNDTIKRRTHLKDRMNECKKRIQTYLV